MGERMNCPGCNSDTSSVLFAVNDGDPCPYCGLSASAIMEVTSIRAMRADAALKERVEALTIERDRLASENASLRGQLDEVALVMHRTASR